MEGSRLEALLAVRDSKGRGLLHLAAKNQTSSTAVKLLLDCGVKVKANNIHIIYIEIKKIFIRIITVVM